MRKGNSNSSRPGIRAGIRNEPCATFCSVLVVKDGKPPVAMQVMGAFDVREEVGSDRGNGFFAVVGWAQDRDPVDTGRLAVGVKALAL